MRVLLFGATGMVGQGVLRECLQAQDVSEVVAIVRSPLDRIPAFGLTEVRHENFFDWGGVDLSGFDACFFCLGVSSLGKREAEYRQVTYDLTLRVAEALLKQSPQAVFCYVSGAGTNANGKQMWARVKGATENALLAMPFRGVYCFRPAYIQPLHGVRSKVRWYNAIYTVLGWAEPLMMRFAPKYVTTTEAVGRAMLKVARDGWPQPVLDSAAINAAAEQWASVEASVRS
ncbi:MAG TPA: epimerase [Acidobacteriaceae bacterium]|nr:epimerase [Acidobacteriaceae bacterium]